MNYMNKESIMDRLREHYEFAQKDITGNIFGIFLQGSQNYINELFSKDSDVDSRAIYVPRKKEICLGIDISEPGLILENGEHIDRFDLRKFLNLIKTPGINNYEALFTEYFIINPKYESFYQKIIELREDLVRVDKKKFLMSIMGISMKDFKTLEHRRGGEDYDIENFGYSRKRLSNIIRFNKTAKAYIEGKDFSECLKSMDEELIYKIRRTDYYTLKQALKIAEEMDQETKEIATNFTVTLSSMDPIIKIEDIFVDIMSTEF